VRCRINVLCPVRRPSSVRPFTPDPGISFRMFAQTFRSPNDRLSQCVADVAEWLSANRLRLNPSKTVDTGHLAGFASANRQGHRPRHRRSVVIGNSQHSRRPRCDRRQPTDHVGTCQRCVSVGVVRIPPAALTCHSSASRRSREDSGSCIHLFAS